MDILICLVITFLILIFCIKSIINSFKPLKIDLQPNFVSGNKNHNEITKIQKGKCILKFENGKFFIIQNENILEELSEDIYNIRVWKFKNSLYMAIRMKTHSEYMFQLAENSENNKYVIAIMYKMAKYIANKLKVEFKDCGESEEE